MNIEVDNKKILTWLTFLKAHSVVLEALEREMRESQHLRLTWFDVLVLLRHARGGKLRMRALAESVFLSHSGLTRLLDRMIAAGLIERQNCTKDRRGWYAVITAKGRETVERAFPGHMKAVQSYFLDCLSDKDIHDLHQIMAKIIGTRKGATVSVKDNLLLMKRKDFGVK
jgi:DNA-binding MarR family transcriptional regulator